MVTVFSFSFYVLIKNLISMCSNYTQYFISHINFRPKSIKTKELYKCYINAGKKASVNKALLYG